MKRIQDKIKDFVEPQAYDEIQNYSNDPPRALAAYRFTDATSDLLAHWLDALADLPRQHGAARAFAGLRGVGKSHTIAAFGALAAYPELRVTVPDAHVATSARRLLNRRYVVARVERGTRPTLQEEMSAAFAAAYGGDESEWHNEPTAMLAVAASRASDAPLVVIVDTAFGREARLRRNDGPVLSQLALATQQINAFIALALDDDIEGADGANVALSGTFQIDYIDPEHLYRIADVHLFKKNAQARAALHDIYMNLRSVVPGFNWSEPRFASIYPVHPLITEITSAVRLYAPAFAFLPFAAMAVQRAASRPALSLITLDEVFDRTEYELRKAEDLKDAFTAYDELATRAVTQLPIIQRLEAKLVLKGLFILSLDGRGATARELAAAMLLYDQDAPDAVLARIEAMLARFSQAAQNNALPSTEDGGELRYRFSISSTAGFDSALNEAIERITLDEATIDNLLRTLGRSRFGDWPLLDTEDGRAPDEAPFVITWRATDRRGRLLYQATQDQEHNANESAKISYDWELMTLGAKVATSTDSAVPMEFLEAGASVRAMWRPATLQTDDEEVLRRLIALRTDALLIADFGETARAAERTHTALAEHIWTRIYLDEGAFVTKTGTYEITPEAHSATTLIEMLSRMFAPLFSERYPQHPVFTEPLGEAEVAHLIGDLFSGVNPSDARVQELARLFAAPLGLVSLRGDTFALEASDQALKQSCVREVLALTDAAGRDVVPLATVRQILKREPFGLSREAQNLILTALVAQRRIELVTKTGGRISRRTLDRALKWDEIAGIARAATLLHSAEELTTWARLLTNNQALASIANPEARETVRHALATWLDSWREARLLEKFDALPDAGLTVTVWNLALGVRKSFAAAADAIEAALSETISLEEGLQRVADAFGDESEQYEHNVERLRKLRSFIENLPKRESVRAYVSMAEPTPSGEIENARRKLLDITEDVHILFDEDVCKLLDQFWCEFRASYNEYYAARHDETVGTSAHRYAIESLTRSDEWREFEALAELSIANRTYWEQAENLLAQIENVQCDLNVRQLLVERPICDCSFSLTRAAALMQATQDIEAMMMRGRDAARRTLTLLSTPLAIALDALARKSGDEESASHARALSAAFARGTGPVQFTHADVQLIEQALQRMATPPPVRVELPDDYGLLTRDELRARLNQWLDDLPDQPALVEVVAKSQDNAA
jgi:hypothetical protein